MRNILLAHSSLILILCGACDNAPSSANVESDAEQVRQVKQELFNGGSQWARAGALTKIYDPSVRESGPWFFNDHSFIRDINGTWHLFGITDEEPVIPPGIVEDSDQFGHATAPSLAGPWTKLPFALTTLDEGAGCTSSTCYHETHLWAPHVISYDGLYYMFYSGGGSDRTNAQINLATSTDLSEWTRLPTGPLFRDGYEARDPMVIRYDDEWIMYYTATDPVEGGKRVVAYRTSSDLISWGPRANAFSDPTNMNGTDAGSTESPFVVQRGEWFYLFIGPRPYDLYLPPSYPGTDVYASKDPKHFDLSQQIGHIAAHAVEVASEGADLYVSHAGWATGGVHIAPLQFLNAPVSGASLYALSPNKDSIWRWSGTGTGWTHIGGASTRLVAGGFGLFSVQPGTGELYVYNNAPHDWTRVSGPATAFAVNAEGLYRRDSAGVSRWSGSGTTWNQIGGPVGSLYVGGSDVFATAPFVGDIYRYSGVPMQWNKVGDSGTTWAINANGLYGLNSWGVYQWSGSGTLWVRIGGPADTLYAGGNKLYATTPFFGDLRQYSNSPNSWTPSSNAATSFAVCDDGLYSLRSSGVFSQTGTAWTQIRGPSAAIVCGR